VLDSVSLKYSYEMTLGRCLVQEWNQGFSVLWVVFSKLLYVPPTERTSTSHIEHKFVQTTENRFIVSYHL